VANGTTEYADGLRKKFDDDGEQALFEILETFRD
jgi:hypothetical protein